MITAKPRHWFSRDLDLFERDARIATLRMPFSGGTGILEINGVAFHVTRAQARQRAFHLGKDAAVLAHAEVSGRLWRRVSIDAGGPPLELRRRALSRRCELLEGDRRVGVLVAAGLFRRRVDADLPARLSLPLRAFIICLAFTSWVRDAR